MMKFDCCPAMSRVPATLMILGMALLIAACSSSSDKTVVEGPPDMPDGNGGPVTDLGEWNTLTPGDLDISDANDVLHAYYESGAGRLMAAEPVQPAGTGTATWTGRWSGKIDVSTDPEASASWGILQVPPNALVALGGPAEITAYFDNGGVEAELAYEDIGLDDSVPFDLDLSDLTSDRAAVTDGSFQLTKTHSSTFNFSFQPGGPEFPTEVNGDFVGEGAFGGTDAKGVVGYIGGPLSLNYGMGPRGLGTFQSVFYGDRDEN